MPAEVIGVFFAMGTATCFGTGTIISRMGLVGTPLFTGTVLSMFAGTLVLMLAASPRYPEYVPQISAEGWAWLVFTAAINYPMGRVFLFQSIGRIGAARGNTIVSANPVVAVTLAMLWFGEQVGVATGVGIAACIFGAMTVARSSHPRVAHGAGGSDGNSEAARAAQRRTLIIGLLAAVGAMASYGTVSALVKKIVTDVTDPIVGASMAFGMGTVMVTLMALPRIHRNVGKIARRQALLLVVGGSTMSLGVLLFYGAASRAPVVAVAPIVSMSPLVTIVMSQILARHLERVDRKVWFGAASVVTGVTLIATAL